MINIKIRNVNNKEIFNKLDNFSDKVEQIKQELITNNIPGNDYTGWFDWCNNPLLFKQLNEINKIKNHLIQNHIDTIVLVGIGGSIIGTKAIIDMFNNPFDEDKLKIVYADSFSTQYTMNLLNYLNDKNWAAIIISKSGTTFETMLNFRLLREQLLNQFKNHWNEHMIIITDQEKGVLRNIVNQYHIQSLSIERNIGGRFSTLTAVGLLPFALLDFDNSEILNGYNDYINQFKHKNAFECSAVKYVIFRYVMKNDFHKDIEVFATYEQNLRSISEYYKQIFAETEGKKENILIPTIANYSNDLHSIGQLYQQGPKNFFETILMYKQINGSVTIPKSSFTNDDKLDNVVNKNLLQLNYYLQEAVISAHNSIPTIIIEMDSCDYYHAGQLFAFLNIAATFSARINDLNPFDQPGVENYKINLKKIISE